ncbi:MULTISPECIES: hypothetical protein [unclassified Nocardioides]|uniref:hypothetical protein n=1 Tax=unclassified Nocardioides TaxID=2615069 RepID=UPI0006F1ED22|nr:MULTISPECIES: hypothetical protein [unclassified Nocardioides]KRA37965.1 hypothetical protein ASD81_04580 [Nocardioides sp. Root614]KRA91925.1 hypothetical protein ASD84_04845 [Nocardioides sp. Root682]
MHELPLTKDLVAALERAGVDPTSAEPGVVVVLAAYLDLLAKEYGLSESLDLDTDPLERAQQPGPVMDVVRHYLASGATELGAESVRLGLYNVFVGLAGDASARKTLNQNIPLTESKLGYLAQIYWNLEANDGRPRLPIKPAGGRDIPVPDFPRDFATMQWTARCNEKGLSYKSSGAGFRKQGARLVVLAAKKLMENSQPMPDTARTALAMQPTSNPEAPLEITLKDLVKRAQTEGQHEVAVQTATSYLSIIQQRAEVNPFESEPELAEAYMLRGWAQMHLNTDRMERGTRADFSQKGDIDAAISSLSTLVDLDPDNVDHRANLVEAYIVLSMWQFGADDSAAAVATTHQALATAEVLPADHKERLKAETVLYYVLATQSDGSAAIEAAERAESSLAKIEAMEPSERPEDMGPDAIATVRTQIQQASLGPAAFESLSEAVVAAERLVAAGESESSVIVDPLVKLAMALLQSGRHSETAQTAARALALVTPEYVHAHPRFQLSLLIAMVWGGDKFDFDRITEAHAALLEDANEAAPGNMRTLGLLLVAFMGLAMRRGDAGLGADAHDWVLRGVDAARRIRPTDILEESKNIFVGPLTYLFAHLNARVSLESDDESAEPRETIARLLDEIEPGWAGEGPRT